MEKNRYVISRAGSSVPASRDCAAGKLDKPMASGLEFARPERKPPIPFSRQYVAERFTNFSVRLDRTDQERYVRSFLKKRILQVWSKKRLLVMASSKFPPPIETAILGSVWHEIKPLIPSAYREDFELPLIPFTLFGWLQYLKLTAQIVGRPLEAQYWDEMTRFAIICSESNLLDELFEL
jgi:hypothetical protein